MCMTQAPLFLSIGVIIGISLCLFCVCAIYTTFFISNHYNLGECAPNDNGKAYKDNQSQESERTQQDYERQYVQPVKSTLAMYNVLRQGVTNDASKKISHSD